MGKVKLQITKPYPKQVAFFNATSKYIAYGGARGGGKSWAARVKAVLLALNYRGLQILLLRRTLAELRENHTIPLLKLLRGLAQYKEQSKEFIFPNGSRIVLGYCAAESDVLQYQGQAYDVIFMEEATQFTEFQFTTLTESNRSSGLCKDKFKPRMYFTCNPGGVGHAWVKRLFIDKDYQNSERSGDYTFIKALVYENDYLMHNDPDYVRTLENLPEARRKAMLYGDWDIFEGQYFSEFRRDKHVCEPFEIPKHWRRYISLDYGTDMLAALWIAVNEQGKAYVYRELYEGRDNKKGEGGNGHIISAAANRLKEEMHGEEIYSILAPPDLWNARQESGKSAAEIFSENGVMLTKTSNKRVNGWLATREWLKFQTQEDGTQAPALRIFNSCYNLIRTLPAIQHDSKNPEDVANEPHEYTHAPDALRYFCVYRTYAARAQGGYTRTLLEKLGGGKDEIKDYREGGKYNVI
ncbi:MAG: phage terminase large subunit [Oscillospiraceae bacterium]